MFGHRHGHGHGGPFGRHAGSFFGEMFRQGSPRARRGDIRAGILALLKEGPRNGYQLMQELSDRSGGMWRPSPGSVYPALQLLEDEGLVEIESSANGKTYALTKKGKTYVAENAEEIGEPWKRAGQEPGGMNGDEMMELMKLIKHLAPAVMQVAAQGSSAQIKEARKILAEARRKIYRLLADDEGDEGDDEESDAR